MGETTQLLFLIIKVALGNADKLPRSLNDREWEGIYDAAQKQSLLGILYPIIEILPKEQRPPLELMMTWVGMVEKIKARNNIVNKRIVEITQKFAQADFKTSVLKGQGTAMLYPSPIYRQSGDIDLWVDGDRDVFLDYAKSFGKISSVDIKHSDFHCFDDVVVELHSLPTWFYNPRVNTLFLSWLSSVKNKQFEKNTLEFAFPTIYFNLVYSLIHIYRHLFNEGIGLRQLMDYYYILIHSTVEERNNAFGYLCQFGMRRFVAAVMYIQKYVFDIDDVFLLCNPSEKYGKKILNDIIVGGNFGQYDNRNHHGIENVIQRGIRNYNHNMNLLLDYPSEVLWSPIWKCWHWCWRKRHGYL